MANIEDCVREIVKDVLKNGNYCTKQDINGLIDEKVSALRTDLEKDNSDLHLEIEKIGGRCDQLWDQLHPVPGIKWKWKNLWEWAIFWK